MNQKKTGKRLNNIEFLRFFFALCIIYFHLLHSAIMPYTGETEIYQYLAEQSRYAKYIVECFFIISGYFLFQSVQRNPQRSTARFILQRVIRLWPVLACSTILSIIFMNKSVSSGLLNLCFLQSTSLTTDWKGLNWYVSALFIAEIFYFMLYKAVQSTAGRRLLTCLLVYCGYSLNLMTTDGEFGRKVVYGIFSLAIARAVAGIGLGCLLGELVQKMRESERSIWALYGTRRVVSIISILEAGTVIFLLRDFFMGKSAPENQFIVVILFSVLFLCMLTGKGFLSRAFIRSRLWILGKYSYSIYVMQETAFLILRNTVWKKEILVQEHVFLCLVVSVSVTAALGIIFYYLVERPAEKKLLLLTER